MFTGIIQHVGTVRSARQTSAGARLTIDLGPLTTGLRLGDSVATNGACLTAATIEGEAAGFDVIRETLDHTTLGSLRAGMKVNLERALAATGRFDGHIVQGHIDGVAAVRRIEKGREWRIECAPQRAQDNLLSLMVPKGSITIDGVSLTLADVTKETFCVALIPTTLAETALETLAVGQAVNIETDILGKYVQRTLQAMLAGETATAGGVTLEKLRQAGFA